MFDRSVANLRWYDRLPLALSIVLTVLISVIVNHAPPHEETSMGIGMIPEIVHTEETYVVSCRNAQQPEETARAVAITHATKVVNAYGLALSKYEAVRIE
jgi:hypothetical protein